MEPNSISQWLSEVCEREHLSLRQAAARAGLSHATIAEVKRRGSASPETIRKLAYAFGGDGHEGLALEDKLLILAGYRTQRVENEISQPLGRLMDVIAPFSEPQLRLMVRFAEFLAGMEK